MHLKDKKIYIKRYVYAIIAQMPIAAHWVRQLQSRCSRKKNAWKELFGTASVSLMPTNHLIERPLSSFDQKKKHKKSALMRE